MQKTKTTKKTVDLYISCYYPTAQLLKLYDFPKRKEKYQDKHKFYVFLLR